MSRRRNLEFFCVVIAAAMVGFWGMPYGRPPGVERGTVSSSNAKLGMTRAQLLAVKGQPQIRHSEEWFYNSSDTRDVYVLFEDGKIVRSWGNYLEISGRKVGDLSTPPQQLRRVLGAPTWSGEERSPNPHADPPLGRWDYRDLGLTIYFKKSSRLPVCYCLQ